VSSLFQSLSLSEEFDLIAVLALAYNNSYQWRIKRGRQLPLGRKKCLGWPTFYAAHSR
jgi:hypothetical protein